MVTDWSEIQTSPEYQALNPNQQQQLRLRYWNNVVTKDPEFSDLGSGQQQQLRGVFLNPPEAQRIISEPLTETEQRQMAYEDWVSEQIKAGKIEPVEPTFMQRFYADLPQMAGGTAGGLAGAKAGAMIGARIPATHPYLKGAAILGGATLGAVLGGMGGKGWQQTYRMTRPGARAMPLKDVYFEQLVSGIEEGVSELAGRGAAWGFGRIGARIGERIATPGAREAVLTLRQLGAERVLRESGLSEDLTRQAINVMKERGQKEAVKFLNQAGQKQAAKAVSRIRVPITLAQATKYRAFDLFEGIAESSFLGGGRMYKIRRILQPKMLTEAIETLSDDFALAAGRKMTEEEIGELVLDSITRENKAFHTAARSLYKQVDNYVSFAGRAKEGIVDLTPMKRWAGSRLESRIQIARSQMGDDLLRDIMNLPDTATFEQAVSLRSGLMARQRAMTTGRDAATGVAKHLTKMSDEVIDSASERLPKEAYDMWRFANKFYREGSEKFNAKIIKRLGRTLRDNPEKAVPILFQKGAGKQIRHTLDLVDTETANALRHGYIEQVIRKSISSETDEFVGRRFLRQLDDDVLKAAFSAEEITSIKGLGKAATLLQRPTQEMGKSAVILIPILQAGAITNRGFARKPGQAAAIFITPYAYARIATSKRWSRMLAEGIKDPIKSSVSLTRVLRIAADLDREHIKEQQIEKGYEKAKKIQAR